MRRRRIWKPKPPPETPSLRPHGPAGLARLVRDILALDRRALAILVSVPFCLTLFDYFGLPWHYRVYAKGAHWASNRRVMIDNLRADPPGAGWLKGIDLPGPPQLEHYLWWGLACLVFLVMIPMIVGALVGASPRELGIRVKGTLRDGWTYLLLFIIFLPVLLLVSRDPAFQNTYPFYKPRGDTIGWDFVFFEVIYLSQFFAIEFFFRGFMVLGLKPRLGMASVLVMLAPYCMIHYYKPMPEALGAIGAGLVLGLLSWRTGTILYGWFLHFAVALTMDLLGLHHMGLL